MYYEQQLMNSKQSCYIFIDAEMDYNKEIWKEDLKSK